LVRIGILEDDGQAAAVMAKHIERFSEEENCAFQVTRFENAVALLDARTSFDILFMDIELEGMNGYEAAKRIRSVDEQVIIIFATHMTNFAVAGYEVSALDFIVKPVEYAPFYMKMKRALAYLNRAAARMITIRRNKQLLRMQLGRLKYVESKGHTLFYHFEDEVIDARGKLSDLEEELEGCHFARCNSCYLVNLAFVVRVDGLNVYVGQNEVLRMSRTKRTKFLSQVGEYIAGGVV